MAPPASTGEVPSLATFHHLLCQVLGGKMSETKTSWYDMCQGLNSHCFHMIWDGHQPYSRGLFYAYCKDSYKRWDGHPQYREFGPCDTWFWGWDLFEMHWMKMACVFQTIMKGNNNTTSTGQYLRWKWNLEPVTPGTRWYHFSPRCSFLAKTLLS